MRTPFGQQKETHSDKCSNQGSDSQEHAEDGQDAHRFILVVVVLGFPTLGTMHDACHSINGWQASPTS
jgi:hypothetical protein